MLESYFKHEEERKHLGIPPLPLASGQVSEICSLLENPPQGKEDLLLSLLKNCVAPGVDPSAEIKAEWLHRVAKGEVSSPVLPKTEAVFLLGTMLGGFNVEPLIELLSVDELASEAASSLKNTILVYNAFDIIASLADTNSFARDVLRSWADGEWFLSKPELPKKIRLTIFKVDGETNTDDFSPAKHAWSRPDIPLHALSMGESKFSGALEAIRKFRSEGKKVVFAGDVVGTGSSRKSATNSLMWHIGENIPYVPNKRRGGVVLGGLIAPIFFNTVEDSGGLPILCDVSLFRTGNEIIVDTESGTILSESGEILSRFDLKPDTLKDEYRAGGRLFLIIGRALTIKARKNLGMSETTGFFTEIENPKAAENQGYTLAQKIVGKACHQKGVLPKTSCEPKMTTVASQDTTGPMTADELRELACMEFQSDLFMQTFCHTAAYPKLADVKMHKSLAQFITERKGVVFRPGDGVLHSWLNRLLLPDTMGTGGDSHTRFPMGLSFPAGSGLVAFAGTQGFIPLNMPESVLVKFTGHLNPGITLRDVVNAIPYAAIQQGYLTVEKEGKKNIFNGRILELEGLPDLSVEQAFELTDSSAERSAAGSTIALNKESVTTYLKSNITLLEKLIEDGYQDADTLRRRIDSVQEWLENPSLLEKDENAEYAAVIEIELSEIREPILACLNDPDNVKTLSQMAGKKIDEIFIGSCMANIGHFRAAGHIFDGAGYLKTRIWIAPPTKMDMAQLKREGFYSIYASIGARTEIPGCSLCMGNQARVRPKATVISTSTRNFDNRMGDGAVVHLGSAELAAIAALSGKIPTADEYFDIFRRKITPKKEDIYRYLQFNKMKNLTLEY